MYNRFSEIPKNELISMLVNYTPIAYIVLDDEYRIHFINENFLKLRKLKLESTLGELCYNISNAGTPCEKCAVAKAFCTGEKTMVSRKDILPDKSIRFIDDYAIPLYKDENTGKLFVLEMMVNRTQEMQSRELRDNTFTEVLSILLSLIDAKDEYTATHSQSVHDVAMEIGAGLGLSDKKLFELSISAILHDIGKVHIPNGILNKQGKLSNEEFEIIKSHTSLSYKMLKGLVRFGNIREGVLHHHERIDGRGYPDGLEGDEIPLNAKIIAVADTYDAMTSTRSYRKALSYEEAAQEIKRVSGTQLDSKVVDVFLSINKNNNRDNVKEKDIQIERVLESQKVFHMNLNKKKEDFVVSIDQDRMLQGILDNTPCGYVILDKKGKVIYASEYFFELMCLTKEETIGKHCYTINEHKSSECKHCGILKSVKSKKVEFVRKEEKTKNGNKIFDMYGIPVLGDKDEVEFVIQIIIERTDEIIMERQREVDYEKIIEMLNNVVKDKDIDEGEERLKFQVPELCNRLDNLMCL